MRFPHDYHLHSWHSGDNDAPMEAVCEAAIARGVDEICFTEHLELLGGRPRTAPFPLEAWAAELALCRERFGRRLAVRAGLEVSEPHAEPDAVAAILARYPFDLVIGSVHWVGGQSVFDPAFYARPADEAYGLYFAELARMVDSGELDVVGHLDVAARVGHAVYGGYDPARYEHLIRPILARCVARGLALDVNARYATHGLRRLTPGVEILRWYVELGGERVTFSSDAHAPAQVGANLEHAIAAARAVGIRRTLRFERRVATWVEL